MIPLTLTLTLSLTPQQHRAIQNLAQLFGCTPDQVCAHVLMYGFWKYLERHGVKAP